VIRTLRSLRCILQASLAEVSPGEVGPTREPGRWDAGSADRASSVPMTGHSATTAMPRRGVLRLVVLALTLAGFATMHALGSVAGDGKHCGSPPALIILADDHGADEMATAHAAVSTMHDDRTHALASMADRHSDDLTTGCLLALLGALVAIGLRLLRRFGSDTTSPRVRHASFWLQAARAPPDPLFLSLCVFRL